MNKYRQQLLKLKLGESFMIPLDQCSGRPKPFATWGIGNMIYALDTTPSGVSVRRIK